MKYNSALLLDLFEFPHLVLRSGNSSGKLGQSQGSFYLFPFFQGSLAMLPIAQVLKRNFLFWHLLHFFGPGQAVAGPVLAVFGGRAGVSRLECGRGSCENTSTGTCLVVQRLKTPLS